jgi:hypothetical protein
MFQCCYNKKMKNKLPTILLTLSLTTLFSFNEGDQIELDGFVNARTNPSFYKYNKNIKTQLSKGTTGLVLEVKEFSQGNAGIKMKVTSGPKAGQSYWVYYNSKTPSIKLSERKPTAVKERELSIKDIQHSDLAIDKDLVQLEDIKAETIEPVVGVRDPEEHAIVESAKEVETLKTEVDKVLSTIEDQRLADCANSEIVPELKEPTIPPLPILSSTQEDLKVKLEDLNFLTRDVATTTNEKDYNIQDSVQPFRESPSSVFTFSSVGSVSSRKNSVDVYRNGRGGDIEGFIVTNRGPNKIVKGDPAYLRKFEFMYDDRARSDMKLVIGEIDNDKTSLTSYSIMVFFPRSVLPSAKLEGEELIVTLPNKEIVKYDANTNEIIGGVLTEEKMLDKNTSKKAAPVKYTGAGVVIRADKAGDLPYGDIEVYDDNNKGSSAPSTTMATISKKGQKDCKIPSKDIWYNDKKLSRVLMMPELRDDKDFDNFLQKRCGFSIY